MGSTPGMSRGHIRTIVGWDKDSTLVSTLHRQHLAEKCFEGKLSWEDYALACADDEPFEDVVELMRLLQPHHLQYVMSGADESAASLVQETFARYSVPVDKLLMKPPGWDTSESSWNARLKIKWIEELQRDGYDVVLFVEDWPETADLIRKGTDVPVLVLNPCYPPELEAAMAIRKGNV